MDQEDRVVVGNTDLMKCITNYYKNLFVQPDETQITLVKSQTDDIPQVIETENKLLTTDFTEAEIKEAVFQIEHYKAPGTDGFPAKFYQVFWEIIKMY